MTLQETVQALEAKNITVATNLGLHQRCHIDSNCPIAIELRRIIVEAGITLPELLEGYQAVTAPNPVGVQTLPEFDGRATIRIAGKTLHLDFNDIISEQLRFVVNEKLANLNRQENALRRIASSLHSSYLYEIVKVRDNRTLPQLSFSERELIRAKCLITCAGSAYIFIFPEVYKAEYIIRDGIRYKLSDRDIVSLTHDVLLKFVITAKNSFTSAALFASTGEKFYHYHGNDNDCWGAVTLPHTWDRTLTSLRQLATSLMRALATINRNSILLSDPPHMPHISELLLRSTELGREGELEAPAETPRRGGTRWGERRQRRQPQPTEWTVVARAEVGTRGAEMLRRFNVEYTDEMGLICALCGETYGQHYGGQDEIFCPRDWERRERGNA